MTASSASPEATAMTIATKRTNHGSVKAEVTQLAILRSAEALFAERGVDAVSLREVSAHAGQRNHSAVLYHFGDKRDLLEALLSRHSGPIDAAFPSQLAALQAAGDESLVNLVKILVTPLAAKLDDPDGGPQYLQICAELSFSRSYPLPSLRAANGPGASELMQRLGPYLRMKDSRLIPLRMLRTASVLFGSLAAFQRLRESGLDLPREVFDEDLVQSLVALFSAP